MAVFSVHLPPEGARDAPDAAFVRQGFCWPAFVFGPFWLLARGFFLAAAIWIALILGLAALAGASIVWPGGAFALALLMHAWLGVEASRFVERRLARRGYGLALIAAAPTLEEAEMSFFRGLGATPPEPPAPHVPPRPLGVLGSLPPAQTRGGV